MAVKIDKDTCIGCEACVAVCPVGALSMVDGKSTVNEDTCIECGACIHNCPVEAISLPKVEKVVANSEGEDIWVMAQIEDGQPLGVTFELIGQAKKLAAKCNQKSAVVLIAKEDNGISDRFIAAGVDRVYVITGEQYADYNTEIYTNAFCELAKVHKPNAVLFPATLDGRDLAPRVAARLHTGLCADCTGLDIREDGIVEWTRPALGGNILATILCDESRPQMGSVRPKVFEPAEEIGGNGEVVKYEVQNPIDALVQLLKKEAMDTTGGIKVEDAEVIVAGGRGMGSAENFKVLEELAALFDNAAMAGSRAAVDEKWVDHASQIGQSGKTVKPKLYFAVGISGVLQHTSGMKESEVIVAINKDPNAEIFKLAHYGIVGDANVIVPKLIEKIKALKES